MVAMKMGSKTSLVNLTRMDVLPTAVSPINISFTLGTGDAGDTPVIPRRVDRRGEGRSQRSLDETYMYICMPVWGLCIVYNHSHVDHESVIKYILHVYIYVPVWMSVYHKIVYT